MPSVREIAKSAGVSIGTVSRVLNNKPHVSAAARAKVLQAANRMPASRPVGGRAGTTSIALVYGGRSTLNTTFDSAILHGIAEALATTTHDLMIVSASRGRGPDESLGQMLMRRGVVGALLRTTTETHGICDELAEDGFAAVALADRIDHDRIGSVWADATPSIERGLEHLLHLGHRKIAIALNVIDDFDHAHRLDTYRRFVQTHGLEFDERWVVRSPANHDGGGASLRQLMALPERPTAVFAADPALGAGICNEALRLGIKLPDELSLIGFDDTNERFGTFPRMSSICQDAVALGVEGLQQLLTLVERREPAERHVTVPSWFEPLDSTAPPSA
ncbi:LacI family DNA-binding transcriptional regulator [Algisphaera agarilytica]|uniref:LacI family transcriptional regulator n=1 Tax=Algisphaera agarilytica TaxID=1385975 RepID=A0A7X0H5P2_9BACT|nr:LacI family DNA-binding transcriptional regulator [Algisphaera agarilytica]MBB6429532.1 LacI family transcriptional regulator [Algisphaera agarilytica]